MVYALFGLGGVMKKFAYIIAVIALSIMLLGNPLHAYRDAAYQSGIASFYANKFNGRRTANGEIFSNNKMTAAHKTLKFGTMVRVTNRRNGRYVTVRINDRGPWIKGRVIDLSRAAAREIGMVKRGTARVDIEVIK